MKKIILLVVMGLMAVAGLIGFNTGSVSAMSLSLSPMKQSIMLVPGETYEGSITVSNPADATEDLNYTVSVKPYSVKKNENGQDDYDNFDIEQMTTLNEIVNWITLKNNNGTLKPNGSTKVYFTVKTPKDAPAGGQYAALVVAMGDKVEQEGNGLVINERWQMTSKIYAEVMGETIQKGAILDNTVPAFLLNNTLTTTSMVENRGNVHTDAKYTLQVWPMGSDEEICTNEENQSTDIVLPNTKKFHQETCNLPSVGIYKVKQTVEIFGEKSEIEKMIIYCPIWMMLVILFGIAMIIIWLVMSARGRKNTARKA